MGKDMKDLFLSQVKILQVCKRCLEQIAAVELTVELPQEICHSSCEHCLANGKVCAEKKQPSHVHSLHACQKCIDDGEQYVMYCTCADNGLRKGKQKSNGTNQQHAGR